MLSTFYKQAINMKIKHTPLTRSIFCGLTILVLAIAPALAEDGILIQSVTLDGDTDFLPEPLSADTIRSGFEGKSFTQEDLEKRLKHINDILLDQGFYLARIEPNYDDIENGNLGLSIDKGRIGKIDFHTLPGKYRGTEAEERKTIRKPYTDGYFSADKLRPRFTTSDGDTPFNYNELHKEIFSVNSLPDITLNTDLSIREEDGQRYMDLDFYVEDRMPIHGVLEFKNTGTRATDEERVTLTLQHLNLTRNEDTLTVEMLSSLDLETLRNISGSYNIPYQAGGEGGGISFFGGYSELNVDEIVSGIDLAADGWHIGNRNFHHIIDNEKLTFNVAYGILLNQLSDSLEVRNGEQVKTEIDTAPASVGLIMHSNRPDALNGRNFATFLYTYNLGDTFGMTKQDEIEALRPGGSADYSHIQFQASRIQSLGGKIDDNSGERIYQHSAFVNIDIQYAGEPLISSEKKAVGGFETTRGYPENFIAGDNGYTATFALRTLIFKGAFFRYLGRNKSVEDRRRLTADYVQLSLFTDFAYVEGENNGDLAGADESLHSVGGGIRFALTGNSQVKVDYGYPMDKIDGVSDSGRLHFAVEGQF